MVNNIKGAVWLRFYNIDEDWKKEERKVKKNSQNREKTIQNSYPGLNVAVL